MLAWDQDHRLWGEFVPLDREACAGRFGEGGAGREGPPMEGEWEFVFQPLSTTMKSMGAKITHTDLNGQD